MGVFLSTEHTTQEITFSLTLNVSTQNSWELVNYLEEWWRAHLNHGEPAVIASDTDLHSGESCSAHVEDVYLSLPPSTIESVQYK